MIDDTGVKRITFTIIIHVRFAGVDLDMNYCVFIRGDDVDVSQKNVVDSNSTLFAYEKDLCCWKWCRYLVRKGLVFLKHLDLFHEMNFTS